MSLKLKIRDFFSIIPLCHIQDLGHKTAKSCEYTKEFDYTPVAYTGQFWIQENRTHCALEGLEARDPMQKVIPFLIIIIVTMVGWPWWPWGGEGFEEVLIVFQWWGSRGKACRRKWCLTRMAWKRMLFEMKSFWYDWRWWWCWRWFCCWWLCWW